MSSTKRPAVAPTVPSMISLSWPENVSVKTLRSVSMSSLTWALTSISGSDVRPAAERMIPPASSMKNVWPCVMIANCCVDAVLPLPSLSRQALAANVAVTLPVPRLPL